MNITRRSFFSLLAGTVAATALPKLPNAPMPLPVVFNAPIPPPADALALADLHEAFSKIMMQGFKPDFMFMHPQDYAELVRQA
jgi:hypothetical protein